MINESEAEWGQKGLFKVVFVALDATGKPTGKEVEYYLANFDSSKDAESGLSLIHI